MCYEDSDVVAFLDIQPVNAGHLLVVPRAHHESLSDIPYPLAMHLFEVAMELAPVVKQVAGAAGLNIVVNSGAAAGQDVFHYHVHVIPRRADDGDIVRRGDVVTGGQGGEVDVEFVEDVVEGL